jgi:choline-glycine betaine transporter
VTSDPLVPSISYAPPIRWIGIGTASVAIGAAGLLVNVTVAAAMIGQLLKQTGHITHGRSGQPVGAWLLATAGEACLAVVFSVIAVVMGAGLLRGRRFALPLHRRYAWAKLPLAFLFAACVGWGMPFFGVVETAARASAVVLAFLVSGGYALFLLRVVLRS